MISPQRPWWKQKRWIAAGVLWLVIGYPLACGPVYYGIARFWLPRGPARAIVLPCGALLSLTPLIDEWLAYIGWWVDLANRHRFGPEGPPTFRE